MGEDEGQMLHRMHAAACQLLLEDQVDEGSWHGVLSRPLGAADSDTPRLACPDAALVTKDLARREVSQAKRADFEVDLARSEVH